MDKDTELEDLLALVQSPGWTRFREWATEEWGSVAYRRKSQAILKKCSESGKIDLAPNHLMQLETSAAAVEDLFARVADRIKTLRGRAS